MTKIPVTTQDSTVDEWTSALAESTGAPGGGAGTGVMLAIAAALTSMVAGYSEVDDAEHEHLDALHGRARALRAAALQLADEDSAASSAFGAAFRLEPGDQREQAIHQASVDAAKASAALGERAADAISDLEWLARRGNPSLIADVVVACGALRAAVSGARTNVSFDLSSLTSSGLTLQDVEARNPQLWASVARFNDAIARIDQLTAEVDARAAPTDAV